MFIIANRRIQRDPEAGEASGAATSQGATAVEKAVVAPEGSAAAVEGKGAPAPAAAAVVDKGQQLFALQKKLEKDPKYTPTPEEWDVYQEYESGTLKPKAPEGAEGEEGEDDDEEAGGGELDVEVDPGKAAAAGVVTPEIQAAMAELGAKTPAEIPLKLKELRKQLTGKDAQEVARLQNELKKAAQTTEAAQLLPIVWQDALAGDTRAVAWLENRGIPPPGKGKSAGGAAGDAGDDGEIVLEDYPESAFFDGETAKRVNADRKKLSGALNKLRTEVKSLTMENRQIAEFHRARELETKRSSANRDLTLEMMSMTAEPEFGDFKPTSGNLQELFDGYFAGQKDDPVDPRVAPLVEVLELAQSMKMDDWKRALRIAGRYYLSEKMPEKLKNVARKAREELMRHTPSEGLSDLRGKQSDNQPISDALARKYANGELDAPGEWCDEDGVLVDSKVPQIVQKYRLLNQARGR